MRSDGIFYVMLIAAGVLVAGSFFHMSNTIDAQKKEIAVLQEDISAAKENLKKLTAWQADTEEMMRGHAQTVQKQEAEFRSLRAKVKDAYKDKEVRDWGGQPIPVAVRSLLEGKDRK